MITLPNSIVFEEVTERLQRGEIVTILLRGISMQPLLHNGKDKVTLAPIGDHILQKGDVVLFRLNIPQPIYLLHRIIEIDGDRYTMQGDNCVSKEIASRDAIVGILKEIRRPNGKVQPCSGLGWELLSAYALCRKHVHNLARKCLNEKARRWEAPLYFIMLAILMWAPLNGLGIPMDNFIFGIRIDHLYHASIYLFCAFFWQDWLNRNMKLVLLLAILTGIVTEFVQYLLPYRGFDINDLIANILGATIGWFALWMHLKKRIA
ncbi:MAG: VanZ family protein [Bacteroidales bacterium]|nr:VanZ family protein [Candidatus Colimorpha pelethequi]